MRYMPALTVLSVGLSTTGWWSGLSVGVGIVWLGAMVARKE